MTNKAPLDTIDTVIEGIHISWHDVSTLTISGQGWPEETTLFERLPARAQALIPENPWNQSCNAAGICCHFKSNARDFSIRWKDYNGEWALNKNGTEGFALYFYNGDTLQWLGTSKQIEDTHTYKLVNGVMAGNTHEFVLYFPLSKGVKQVEIGIPEGATIEAVQINDSKPIVFYGTSIIQGSCVSRPGNHIVGMIQRDLNYPTLNLGLSGSGKMEIEVVEIIAELDAKIFFIDCLPNMNADEVRERFQNAMRHIRSQHPETPIVVVESIIYQDAPMVIDRDHRCRSSNQALSHEYKKLIADGIKNLHYIKGEELLNGNTDATVDGTHPNDLGTRLMADRFLVTIREILGEA